MSTFDPYGADRRTPAWVWVIGALLIALIALGLVVLFTGGDDDDASAPAPDPGSRTLTASSGPASGASTSPEEQGCGNFTDAPTEEVPADLTATPGTLGVITYPISETSGPVSTDPYPVCWAQTPYGAALAAAGTFAAINDPQHRDAWAEDNIVGDLPPYTDPGTTLRAIGYRLPSYSAEQASVELLIDISGQGTFRIPVPLVWEDARWKADIDAAAEGGEEPYTSSYTLWEM